MLGLFKVTYEPKFPPVTKEQVVALNERRHAAADALEAHRKTTYPAKDPRGEVEWMAKDDKLRTASSNAIAAYHSLYREWEKQGFPS